MRHKGQNIKFHEDIAIADTAFTVKGKNEEELFENAAIALISSMADINKIENKVSREITLNNRKFDILLFDFLNEILLYKDSGNLLFSEFNIKINKNTQGYELKAKISGEAANPEKHKISTDVKAITMHMFKVQKTKEGYEARIVIDI